MTLDVGSHNARYDVLSCPTRLAEEGQATTSGTEQEIAENGMTVLEIELSELEERLAQLKARARAAASAPPKEAGSALNPKWDGRDSFSVPEAAEILGISTWSAYEAIKRSEIPVVRFGRTIRIGRRTIEKMLGA
jgi:excisionase family DNA binding protein